MGYDQSFEEGSEKIYAATRNRECSNSSSTEGISANYAAQIGFSDTKAFKAAWCREGSVISQFDKYFKKNVQTVHDRSISAWEECKKSPGPKLAIQYTDDPNTIIIDVGFVPLYDDRQEARISKIEYMNLECENNNILKIDDLIGDLIPLRCHRKNADLPANVTFALEHIQKTLSATIAARQRREEIKPIYDMTGITLTRSGHYVNFSQDDERLQFVVESPTVHRKFSGIWTSTKIAVGEETITVTDNTAKREICSAQYIVKLEASGSGSFCASFASEDGARTCGQVPEGRGQKQLCIIKSSITEDWFIAY